MRNSLEMGGFVLVDVYIIHLVVDGNNKTLKGRESDEILSEKHVHGVHARPSVCWFPCRIILCILYYCSRIQMELYFMVLFIKRFYIRR